MSEQSNQISGKPSRFSVYLVSFLFALHITPLVYIYSSFLGEHFSGTVVSILYTVSGICALIAFIYIRQWLRRFGNYRVILTLVICEALSLFIFAYSPSSILVAGAFIVSFMVGTLTFLCLDIFLEKLTRNSDTGGVRGLYLTSINLAYVAGPLISALILRSYQFHSVFLVSMFLLLPVLYILMRYFRNFKDPEYNEPNMLMTIRCVWSNKDFHSIFSVAILLRFFFAWMVIYTPVFLHSALGFSFSEITLIIGCGLIPYVLLQAFLGRIADKSFGEKEILILGFAIMVVSTIAIGFVQAPILLLWIGLIFATRIGACMVEVMGETYLFKNIDAKNLNVISIYRLLDSCVYIIAPLIGSAILLKLDFTYLFSILGALMLLGIHFSLRLKDTR